MIITSIGALCLSQAIEWEKRLGASAVEYDLIAETILETLWMSEQLDSLPFKEDPRCHCAATRAPNIGPHLIKDHDSCNPYAGGDYNGHCGGCTECVAMQVSYYERLDRGMNF